MKKYDKRTRAEQFFLLILIFTTIFMVFCFAGCGEKSCEVPKCAVVKVDDANVLGCSIPGCGGCLTPEKGCNMACWPQACKFVSVSEKEKDEETGEKSIFVIHACDTRYYGDGCLGCDQTEKSCYYGYTKVKDEDLKMNGIFFGSSESDELLLGCANGCGGCIGTDGDILYDILELEYSTGVD